jgi:hypothetical protein
MRTLIDARLITLTNDVVKRDNTRADRVNMLTSEEPHLAADDLAPIVIPVE